MHGEHFFRDGAVLWTQYLTWQNSFSYLENFHLLSKKRIQKMEFLYMNNQNKTEKT